MRLHELAAVREDDLRGRIAAKVAGHREADARAGRTWVEEEYVGVEDVLALLREQRARCFACGEHVVPAWTAANDPRQFSIDRINNDEAHLRGNVRIACLACNVSRH